MSFQGKSILHRPFVIVFLSYLAVHDIWKNLLENVCAGVHCQYIVIPVILGWWDVILFRLCIVDHFRTNPGFFPRKNKNGSLKDLGKKFTPPCMFSLGVFEMFKKSFQGYLCRISLYLNQQLGFVSPRKINKTKI